MTLQTKLTELYTPFVNLDCEVNHYRRGKTNRFVVWAEDGEDASFSSDNHKTEQQLTGVVFVAGLESLEEGFSVVGYFDRADIVHRCKCSRIVLHSEVA